MTLIHVGGLSLWYEIVAGPEADPAAMPAVMIQGLGMQATEWPASLIEGLAAERRVILLDNRDAGLSQLFGPAVDASLTVADFPGPEPLSKKAPYALADMAAGVMALLDGLGISQAHVLGFSMGGMIGQILAAQAPSRVASLVGLMTSAGQAWLESSPAAGKMLRQSILFEPDHDRLVAQTLAADEIYAGRSPLPDLPTRRLAVEQSLARAYRPAGIWRQACAIRAAGDRQALLRTIQAPVLMLHGEDDPVIAPRQAAAAGTLIPQTIFEILEVTGHSLTDQIVERIQPRIQQFWSTLSRPSAKV